ncbi:MAG: hypothetical protein FVQ81_13210 [Candidatus Glassbacteria bacterium]|nr:hypothetical protein [Candidatus Glassbacteria bacterium]
MNKLAILIAALVLVSSLTGNAFGQADCALLKAEIEKFQDAVSGLNSAIFIAAMIEEELSVKKMQALGNTMGDQKVRSVVKKQEEALIKQKKAVLDAAGCGAKKSGKESD